MSARYRIVHFVPDPFLGSRVPVAALVERGGTLSVAKLHAIPSVACLGGHQAWSLVQMILDDLSEAVNFDRLPDSLGPQAILDRPRAVPAGVDDPQKWVETCLVAHTAPANTEDEGLRRPQRSTIGFRFFQAYKVDRFIRKTFKPGQDAGQFLPAASTLGSISHFVEGAHDVLLMEPIAPRKPRWKEDVQSVAKTFGAYQTVLRQERGKRRAKLTAYVLVGGSSSDRDSIMRDLTRFADEVIDTSRPPVRERFLKEIHLYWPLWGSRVVGDLIPTPLLVG